MNDNRHDAGQGISIGVLIIGSLYWDSSDHREEWRREHLNQEGEQSVCAPIRYGRSSGTRGCSYTMVFSRSLVREGRCGRAIVVPCQQRVKSVGDLIQEAQCLWTAERRSSSRPNHRISDGWGCVVLLTNPAKEDELRDLRAGWTDHVSREPHCYGRLNSAVDEEATVDEYGFLQIPWPKSKDGSDLGVAMLLATATNPTIIGGHYPSPSQVADAWNTPDGKNYVDYFCKNRAHGIKTFQDSAIEDRLRELWQ